jgi:hypothetical protein
MDILFNHLKENISQTLAFTVQIALMCLCLFTMGGQRSQVVFELYKEVSSFIYL